jgi:glycerol-3-phosphate cytidylyltransferase-like family protein
MLGPICNVWTTGVFQKLHINFTASLEIAYKYTEKVMQLFQSANKMMQMKYKL